METPRPYTYRLADGRYTVSIANRARVEEAIAAACRFDEQMEIAALTGNVSEMDGKIYLHLHVTLGRTDYTALAGHLLSARINGAGEIFITPFDAATPRRYDPETGLNIYDFR